MLPSWVSDNFLLHLKRATHGHTRNVTSERESWIRNPSIHWIHCNPLAHHHLPHIMGPKHEKRSGWIIVIH
jgi:hypothetical protein